MKLLNIANKIKNNWHLGAVILVAVFFFIGTSSYVFVSQKDGFIKWGSPDENANYVFARLYSQTRKLSMNDYISFYSNDIVHPRSVRSDFGVLKPVSFLGIIIIYGFLGSFIKFFNIIPYLTPFFASVGIIFFYLFLKRIFGRRNALISSFILASFPVYIYYSVRSMFHNVLFVDLLIIGMYFFIITTDKIKNNLMALISISFSGFCIGLAIITRTSEAMWVLPILFIIFIFYIRKLGILKFVLFTSFIFLALLIVFYWNTILYGSPINSGYPEMNTSIHSIVESGNDIVNTAIDGNFLKTKSVLERVKNIFFHFGLHPDKSLNMLVEYFIKMFSGLFWFAVFGVFIFISKWNKWKTSYWVYILSYIILSIILIIYYGSWQFFDNPDIHSFTIGNSYTRYWLPVYIGAIPFLSLFIIRFTRGIFFYHDKNIKSYSKWKKFFSINIKKKVFINGLRCLIVLIFMLTSINFVLFGSEEGLMNTLSKTRENKNIYNQVLNLTEENSIIITTYYDKIFFTERRVIFGLLNDNNMNKEYAKISSRFPLYYFSFTFPNDAINYLNQRKLKEVGVTIKKVKTINNIFTLYRIR